jgi:hypothetical protein
MRRAFGCGAVDGLGGGGGERIALAVQADFVNSLHTQRGEGAQADVQRDAGDFDAASGERVEDLRSKVQACGGRGDGAAFAGEDRLVALAVGGSIVAADVGRQRDVADTVERGEEVIDRLETKQTLAELASLQHFGFEGDGTVGRGKDENLADGDLSSRTDEGAPEVFAGRRLRFMVSHPFR